MGNVNINNPTKSDESVSDTDKKLDDLNNKFAQVASFCYALSFQIQKFSSLVQLLTFAVHMIGKTPLKVIDIYDVFPALKDSPFIKFFKHHMNELKAIQLFSEEMLDILSDTLNEAGLNNTKFQINNIKNYVKKGSQYTEYLNYLDMDVESFIKGQVSEYDNIIIEKIPGVEKVRNNAIKATNKAARLISIAERFYNLMKKQFGRKTNSGYFEEEESRLQLELKGDPNAPWNKSNDLGTDIRKYDLNMSENDFPISNSSTNNSNLGTNIDKYKL
jgi:hypothetical protein